MALGLNTESGGGGDYADIVKFDARAGRLFRVDRAQGAAGWETNNVEITNGFQAVMDMENISVGWALFAAGQAPSFAMVPLGHALPARPSDQHKQCFKIMMKLGKSSGGDVREMASQAKVVIGAIDKLHTDFEAGRAANPGKLPVVALTGSTAVVSTGKGQSSTNYAPIFEIKSWVDRPSELPANTNAPTGTGAAQQAAPVQQAITTSQVAPATDDEF
jgi:hypothetical protein